MYKNEPTVIQLFERNFKLDFLSVKYSIDYSNSNTRYKFDSAQPSPARAPAASGDGDWRMAAAAKWRSAGHPHGRLIGKHETTAKRTQSNY